MDLGRAARQKTFGSAYELRCKQMLKGRRAHEEATSLLAMWPRHAQTNLTLQEVTAERTVACVGSCQSLGPMAMGGAR